MPNPSNFTLSNTCTLRFLFPNVEPKLTSLASRLKLKFPTLWVKSTAELLNKSPDQIITFRGHLTDTIEAVIYISKEYIKFDAHHTTKNLLKETYKLVLHQEFAVRLKHEYYGNFGRKKVSYASSNLPQSTETVLEIFGDETYFETSMKNLLKKLSKYQSMNDLKITPKAYNPEKYDEKNFKDSLSFSYQDHVGFSSATPKAESLFSKQSAFRPITPTPHATHGLSHVPSFNKSSLNDDAMSVSSTIIGSVRQDHLNPGNFFAAIRSTNLNPISECNNLMSRNLQNNNVDNNNNSINLYEIEEKINNLQEENLNLKNSLSCLNSFVQELISQGIVHENCYSEYVQFRLSQGNKEEGLRNLTGDQNPHQNFESNQFSSHQTGQKTGHDNQFLNPDQSIYDFGQPDLESTKLNLDAPAQIPNPFLSEPISSINDSRNFNHTFTPASSGYESTQQTFGSTNSFAPPAQKKITDFFGDGKSSISSGNGTSQISTLKSSTNMFGNGNQFGSSVGQSLGLAKDNPFSSEIKNVTEKMSQNKISRFAQIHPPESFSDANKNQTIEDMFGRDDVGRSSSGPKFGFDANKQDRRVVDTTLTDSDDYTDCTGSDLSEISGSTEFTDDDEVYFNDQGKIISADDYMRQYR